MAEILESSKVTNVAGSLDNSSLLRSWINDSTTPQFVGQPHYYPSGYRILATVIHVAIFVIGVCGNVAVVVVVRKTKSLYTPTYCYLVSLAIADLLVLISAMPEAIVSHHLLKRQWVLGQAGCSLLIFGNFLGINASSTSILCFTVERYIGICKPLLAQKLCSVERAKRIIFITWVTAVLYSCPWLGLTTIRTVYYSGLPPKDQCEYRLKREQYVYFFVSDFIVFYAVPLLVAIALYVKIGITLKQRLPTLPYTTMPLSNCKRDSREERLLQLRRKSSYRVQECQDRSTVQVVRMLLVIVILFALLWLPYRAVLVYNSLVTKPWLNMWYMLFAKTCIFLNSAINPVMYNAMSKKFRSAFMGIIFKCNYLKRGSASVPSDSLLSQSISLGSTIFPPSTCAATSTPRGSIPQHPSASAAQRNLSLPFYTYTNCNYPADSRRRYARSCSYGMQPADLLLPIPSVVFSEIAP